MNRVHGDIVIKRRENEKERNYAMYKEKLIEDFHGRCGYCSKDRRVCLEEFHIDHFAPQSKFKDRMNDYSNLVLACPQCNRLKWDKWVTDDSHISHTDKEGFVDPATDEYDEHLYRNENGNILYKTDVGKYMCDVFKFNLRPVSLIWKINKLDELERKMRDDDSYDGLKIHKKLSVMLKDLLEDLRLTKKE